MILYLQHKYFLELQAWKPTRLPACRRYNALFQIQAPSCTCFYTSIWRLFQNPNCTSCRYHTPTYRSLACLKSESQSSAAGAHGDTDTDAVETRRLALPTELPRRELTASPLTGSDQGNQVGTDLTHFLLLVFIHSTVALHKQCKE